MRTFRALLITISPPRPIEPTTQSPRPASASDAREHTMSRRTFPNPRTLTLAPLAAAAMMLAAAPSAPATFPGRNGPIAFYSDTDAGAQIFTVRPNGHDLRQITHVNGDAVRPDWSPDGTRIAFELDTAESASVATMNADGSDIVVLPPAPGGLEGDPSFTADGTRIVFERFVPDTNDDAIWSMNVDGSDPHRLEAGPAGATDPNVSPDGHALSFVSSNGVDSGALFTSRIDGSQQLQLTPVSFDVGIKQDWAPDGRHLAFIHDADLPHPGDSANIATIRPDGTDLRFLTHYQGGEVNAFVGSYSPDGRWIVFRLEDHGRFGLYKMHPDGSHLKPILGLSSFAPRFIDWGPHVAGNGEADDADR
jgi:Tol biopolymer transport system component